MAMAVSCDNFTGSAYYYRAARAKLLIVGQKAEGRLQGEPLSGHFVCIELSHGHIVVQLRQAQRRRPSTSANPAGSSEEFI